VFASTYLDGDVEFNYTRHVVIVIVIVIVVSQRQLECPVEDGAEGELCRLVEDLPVLQRHQQLVQGQGVAAQVEFESKFESSLPYFSCKRLIPGGLNLGFIGSTCTALPRL
jgi:hypothetical protein